MASAAATIPDEQALLCESCGYVLRGLEAESRCPECGREISLSDPALRLPAVWENDEERRGAAVRFVLTTLEVLFRPTNFFRHLMARRSNEAARSFAMIHWAIAAFLLGLGTALHWSWYIGLGSIQNHWIMGPAPLTVGVFAVLWLTTWMAARLTAWEAAYRGLRLPLPVVMRGMYFHSAHYLPVALLAFMTIAGFQLLLKVGVMSGASAPAYLYVLCGEVVVTAGYLFKTYWIGMRNMMYANR